MCVVVSALAADSLPECPLAPRAIPSLPTSFPPSCVKVETYMTPRQPLRASTLPPHDLAKRVCIVYLRVRLRDLEIPIGIGSRIAPA